VASASDNLRAFVGSAFEYAVGLDLAVDAYSDRLVWIPTDRAEWVRSQVARYRQADDGAGTGGLLEAACYLSNVEEFVLKHGLWGNDRNAPFLIAELAKRNAFPDLWPAVEEELRALWALHRERVRDQLAAWGPVVVAVPLLRRVGTYGVHDSFYVDLIAGPLLVEIKTGAMMSDLDLVDAYDQVHRYARIAPTAGHPITAAALYLARYGLLWTWPAPPVDHTPAVP
jgi:hypothetical protein